jgi:hypothetical protein
MLDDDDQEIIRFLRKTGEEHMARKPVSRGVAAVSRTPDERLAYMMRFADPSQMMSGGTRSKWERIGKPLFTPSVEMAMYFTPMNPIVYRMIRYGLTAYDVKEGVYDYD